MVFRQTVRKVFICLVLSFLQASSLAAEVAVARQNVVVTTNVFLIDGSEIKVTLNVIFEGPTTFANELFIRDNVMTWFRGNGRQTTLYQFKQSGNYNGLPDHVKASLSAAAAVVVGYEVTRMPDTDFELRTRTISAILASGQSVEVILAAQSDGGPVLGTWHLAQVVKMLGGMKWEELATLQDRVNKLLARPNMSDTFPVISIRLLACKCS